MPADVLLERIESTFSALDDWQRRGMKAAPPGDGSDLATDDLAWPAFPVSEVARSGLALATDHLLAVRHHVQTKNLFVGAESSLCRAALVGASQGVWVLLPSEREVRVRRALTVAANFLQEHRKFLVDLDGLADGSHAETSCVLDHVRKREKEITELRKQRGDRASLNTTAMIHEAAAATFQDPGLADEVRTEWRRSSAVAHGFAWAVYGTQGTTMDPPIQGLGLQTFSAVAGLNRFANIYLASCHLAKRGWELLEGRSSS